MIDSMASKWYSLLLNSYRQGSLAEAAWVLGAKCADEVATFSDSSTVVSTVAPKNLDHIGEVYLLKIRYFDVPNAHVLNEV